MRVVVAVADLGTAGQTVIVLGEGDRTLAAFGARDEPRLEARSEALCRVRIQHVVMLTGENEVVA